jgi:EmrB/QacA subfamily drug resistance transporter
MTVTQDKARLDPALIKLSVALLVGALAVVFDTTIVNVALDTLGRELAAPVSTIQWVTTGYLLALGMAVPVTPWLLGRFGGKQVWMYALAVFFLGSVAASLAWDAPSLIAFRVVQGIGGGLMLPVMQTLIVQAAGGRSLGSVTAVISLPVLLGPVLGPVVGGVIVNGLAWRWIFWFNIPFCVAGLVLAWLLMPVDVPGGRSRLDGPGLALLSPGIAAVVYGLSRVSGGGFGEVAVVVPLAAGALLIAAFGVRALRPGGEPLVDIRLFRSRPFTASTGVLFLSGFVLYGAMLLIPLYCQRLRGQDALAAGLFLVPQGVGALLSRGIAGKMTDRIGPRWITFAGFVLVVLGTLPFVFADATTSTPLLAAALVVRGIGLGGVTIPVVSSAYQGLARADVPHASVITRTAQQIGGSFGTAVLAVILETRLAVTGTAAAFDATFLWSVGFTVAALFLSLALPSGSPGDDGRG